MSNQDKFSKRLISIKKLSDIKPQQHMESTPTKYKQQAASSIELNGLQQQVSELKGQKEQMLTELRESINQEREAWELEKERERKQARVQGHREGYEQGTLEAQQTWRQALDKVNELADLANADYYRTVEKHEEAILQLAITSAEKILHQHLDKDKTAILGVIQGAVKELEESASIQLNVHPDQYGHVVNLKPELEQVVGIKDLITIHTDPELDSYGCVIKHANGQINASVDMQLKQIKNALSEKVMEQS